MESVVEIEADLIEIIKELEIIKSKLDGGEDTSTEFQDVAASVEDLEILLDETLDLFQSLKSDVF